jgi:hypothetical protein
VITNVDNDEAYTRLLADLSLPSDDIAALFREGVPLPSGAVGRAEASFFLRREAGPRDGMGQAIAQVSRIVKGPSGTVIPEELDAPGFDWLWGQLKRLLADESTVVLYREAGHISTICGYIAEASGSEGEEAHFVVIAEQDPQRAPTVLRVEHFVDILRTMFTCDHGAVLALSCERLCGIAAMMPHAHNGGL